MPKLYLFSWFFIVHIRFLYFSRSAADRNSWSIFCVLWLAIHTWTMIRSSYLVLSFFTRVVSVCTVVPRWQSSFIFVFRCLNSWAWCMTLLSPSKRHTQANSYRSRRLEDIFSGRALFGVPVRCSFLFVLRDWARNQPFLLYASCRRSYSHLMSADLRVALACPHCHTLLPFLALR